MAPIRAPHPSEHPWRVPLGAEVALAYAAGTTSFAVLAVILAVTQSDVVAVLLGGLALTVMAVMVRTVGVAYAVPTAIAGLLAYDWFLFPPTHARAFPHLADLVDLLAYLSISVLVGVLAAHAARRADVTELARSELAGEQAALRRVATLVARHAPPAELFGAVAREAGELLGVDATHLGRYEPDGTVTGIGSWSRTAGHTPLGTRSGVGGHNVTALVRETGRPARVDKYDDASAAVGDALRPPDVRSSVGAPIVVEEHLWGVVIASSYAEQALPPGTEARIGAFTELVATAISNTQAWAETRALAAEQAALRRVATLAAQGVLPDTLFGAVTQEVGRLLASDLAGMLRYEPGDVVAPVATWSAAGPHPEVAARWPLGGDDLVTRIVRTGRPARVDDWSGVEGPIADVVHDALGARSSVGSPIVVEGRLWGMLVVHATRTRELPPDSEGRLTNFTELVATAISNAESRAALTASRARLVAAADDERRRVVHDLHDGAQQRLVHTVVTLKLARRALDQAQDAGPLVTEALDQAQHATAELRELAHGILPAVLTHGGLYEAVNALATRTHVEVDNAVLVDRLAAPVEATAYFVVAEALTNVTKHAAARRAIVTAQIEDGTLNVQVSDDGVGGAVPTGSGLTGLADRLAVLDGDLQIESPPGGGTLITAVIPLGTEPTLRGGGGAPCASRPACR